MTMKRISRAQNNSTPRREYLVEKERIKNEIGNLEEIRLKLGLSQRRACQLLLVDPSAWTRWNKTEAPPHIYQALKWLLELRKVNPEAAGPRNFESRLDFVQSSTQSKIDRLEAHIEMLEKAVSLTATATQYAASPIAEDLSPTIDAIEQKLSVLEMKIEAAQADLAPRKRKRTLRTAKKKANKQRKTKKKPKNRVRNTTKLSRTRRPSPKKVLKSKPKRRLKSRKGLARFLRKK